jgi:hypothetical protein
VSGGRDGSPRTLRRLETWAVRNAKSGLRTLNSSNSNPEYFRVPYPDFFPGSSGPDSVPSSPWVVVVCQRSGRQHAERKYTGGVGGSSTNGRIPETTHETSTSHPLDVMYVLMYIHTSSTCMNTTEISPCRLVEHTPFRHIPLPYPPPGEVDEVTCINLRG